MILKRRLKSGEEVEELQEPIALIIWTKVPEKWEIKDLETEEIYRGNKEQHKKYGNILSNLVGNIRIGQWKKNDNT
jgi:hypothetical protein